MYLLSVTKLVFATYQTLLSQLIHPSLLRPPDRSVRTLLYTYLLQFNKQNPCQFPLKCYIIYNSYTIKGLQVTSARANVSPAYTRFLKPSNSPTNSTIISFSNFFISSPSRSRISVVTIADVPMHWTHPTSPAIVCSFGTVLSPSSLHAPQSHAPFLLHHFATALHNSWSSLDLCQHILSYMELENTMS